MKWYWTILILLLVVSVVLHMSGVIKLDTSKHWTIWIVVGLVLLNGGWMAFDGGRALIVGDYVTPKSGEMAGMLGPWSKIVAAIGIEPRSTLMKSIFLVYGLAYVIAMAAFLLKASWAWSGLLIIAILGLWYIPFGTVINIIVIILLLLTPLRH